MTSRTGAWFNAPCRHQLPFICKICKLTLSLSSVSIIREAVVNDKMVANEGSVIFLLQLRKFSSSK